VDVNRAWEIIRGNIKVSAKESLGYYALKKQKEYSELLDIRKQAKLQWLHNPSEINGDNLNNIKRAFSRYFRTEKRENLEDKINDLATNRKNMNIRDLYRRINEFRRGYPPRSNLVKDKNGDLLAESYNILNTSLLLNERRVSDVRQIEIHRAEPLVPDPSPFDSGIVVAKLK
jgi:hypothetical protein